ncbi:hypothetical protein VHEMI09559 [[Torrubiella] hemipterigena]|uniref:Uncharacterized protein n=1 Tax=[Torrubiella] hemipterigena TaxID=1531966 RepID=A0A0A1TRP9_9HYPO|nr:hypothetical protein VHEMI09559 [[Torrubiella] hemipterigena]
MLFKSAFSAGRYRLDLCQIIWGRRQAQYEFEFSVNDGNLYTVYIRREDDHPLDNPLYAVRNCATAAAAWDLIDEQLTQMATEIMSREWELTPEEISQIYDGPSGGLLARFDFVLEERNRRQL